MCEREKVATITTTKPQAPTGAAACDAPYILNPVSSTCVGIGPRPMVCSEAKEYCEAAGEKLAVFDGLMTLLHQESILNIGLGHNL